MKLIATHDSATGEKPLWYCWPLLPFAKTQSKTIAEQLVAGCRMFDIRIRRHRGTYRLAHGGYILKPYPSEILQMLNDCPFIVYVTITYEGFLNPDRRDDFMSYVWYLKDRFSNLRFGTIAVKKGKGSTLIKTKYEVLEDPESNWALCPQVSQFVKLDGSNWSWLMPIPWLWKLLAHNKPDFKENVWTYVDFL